MVEVSGTARHNALKSTWLTGIADDIMTDFGVTRLLVHLDAVDTCPLTVMSK
jgi:hypothetical protein